MVEWQYGRHDDRSGYAKSAAVVLVEPVVRDLVCEEWKE